MRISHVQNNNNYNNKYYQPSFGIWHRDVYKTGKDGMEKLSHRNDTCFFRNGFFWENLTNYLEQKFSKTDKVNVYCYGCSDGSEPYTFAMKVLARGKDFAQKFLPIQARDIDGIAICKALDGEYKLGSYEIFHFEQYLTDGFVKAGEDVVKIKKSKSSNLREFFDYSEYSRDYLMPDGKLEVKAKDVLKKTVKFAMGDIFEDYKNINPDNAIVFARNFWPYIEDAQKRSEFFKKLYGHLHEGSLFVIGDFDAVEARDGSYFFGSVKKEIKRAGFVETELENVFEKR